jgi:hypothetical protein
MKITKIIKKLVIYVASGLGALGNALQSYMAVVDLIKSLISGALAASSGGLVFMHGIAVGVGGICGGIINFFINVELLESFYKRMTGKKPMPQLEGWQKCQYWFGSIIFIVTGLLFGLTAFAFGPVGTLAAIAIAAGIFVAVIMMVQELETWLESFDDEKENKKSITQKFDEWYASLTPSKVLGIAIALGNVLALSLLFTLGMATFLSGIGVAVLPALAIGLAVGFTGGAFTEFYFYNRFLSDFCEKIADKWNAFCAAKYSPLGFVMSAINACVFGTSCYVGITMLAGVMTAASIALPPLGVIIAIAATAAVFAAAASFVLGLSFWQRNSGKIFSALPDCSCTSSTAMVSARLGADLSFPQSALIMRDEDAQEQAPLVSSHVRPQNPDDITPTQKIEFAM